MMSYFPEKKPGPTSKNWLRDASSGLYEFLEVGDWLYDFSEESVPSNKDCEVSYLSQCFFYELMHILDADGVLINDENNRKICVKLVDENQSQEFHFDVMNNPKTTRRKFSSGIKNKCPKEWEKWRGIYHTIGNLTPIPWPCNGTVEPNLQTKHSNLDERWDLFLHYLRCEWSKDWEVGISFFQYMQLTCQEVYYQKVYDDFFKNKNLETIDDQDLLGWYKKLKENEWYEKLEEDGRLISFGEDAKENVEITINLISLRGRLVMALVRRKMGIHKDIVNGGY